MSELNQASIMTFFHKTFFFPNSYAVAMTQVINPFDYPSPAHVSSECKWQLNVYTVTKSHRKQRRSKSCVRAPQWSPGSTICGDGYAGNTHNEKCRPSSYCPHVLTNDSEVVSPYLSLLSVCLCIRIPVGRPVQMLITLLSEHKKIFFEPNSNHLTSGKASFLKHQMALDLVPWDKVYYWSGGICETLVLAMNWGSQLKELHLNRTVMWSHNHVSLTLAWGGQIAFVTRAK